MPFSADSLLSEIRGLVRRGEVGYGGDTAPEIEAALDQLAAQTREWLLSGGRNGPAQLLVLDWATDSNSASRYPPLTSATVEHAFQAHMRNLALATYRARLGGHLSDDALPRGANSLFDMDRRAQLAVFRAYFREFADLTIGLGYTRPVDVSRLPVLTMNADEVRDVRSLFPELTDDGFAEVLLRHPYATVAAGQRAVRQTGRIIREARFPVTQRQAERLLGRPDWAQTVNAANPLMSDLGVQWPDADLEQLAELALFDQARATNVLEHRVAPPDFLLPPEIELSQHSVLLDAQTFLWFYSIYVREDRGRDAYFMDQLAQVACLAPISVGILRARAAGGAVSEEERALCQSALDYIDDHAMEIGVDAEDLGALSGSDGTEQDAAADTEMPRVPVGSLHTLEELDECLEMVQLDGIFLVTARPSLLNQRDQAGVRIFDPQQAVEAIARSTRRTGTAWRTYTQLPHLDRGVDPVQIYREFEDRVAAPGLVITRQYGTYDTRIERMPTELVWPAEWQDGPVFVPTTRVVEGLLRSGQAEAVQWWLGPDRFRVPNTVIAELREKARRDPVLAGLVESHPFANVLRDGNDHGTVARVFETANPDRHFSSDGLEGAGTAAAVALASAHPGRILVVDSRERSAVHTRYLVAARQLQVEPAPRADVRQFFEALGAADADPARWFEGFEAWRQAPGVFVDRDARRETFESFALGTSAHRSGLTAQPASVQAVFRVSQGDDRAVFVDNQTIEALLRLAESDPVAGRAINETLPGRVTRTTAFDEHVRGTDLARHVVHDSRRLLGFAPYPERFAGDLAKVQRAVRRSGVVTPVSGEGRAHFSPPELAELAMIASRTPNATLVVRGDVEAARRIAEVATEAMHRQGHEDAQVPRVAGLRDLVIDAAAQPEATPREQEGLQRAHMRLRVGSRDQTVIEPLDGREFRSAVAARRTEIIREREQAAHERPAVAGRAADRAGEEMRNRPSRRRQGVRARPDGNRDRGDRPGRERRHGRDGDGGGGEASGADGRTVRPPRQPSSPGAPAAAGESDRPRVPPAIFLAPRRVTSDGPASSGNRGEGPARGRGSVAHQGHRDPLRARLTPRPEVRPRERDRVGRHEAPSPVARDLQLTPAPTSRT